MSRIQQGYASEESDHKQMVIQKDYSFTVAGKVKAKQSTKIARAGKFIKTYTSKDIVEYSNWVRQCFFNVYPRAKASDLEDCYLKVYIQVYFAVPKSFSKRKKQEALEQKIFPAVKPDWDNISKNICDSLNGIAYPDDKAIVRGCVSKFYGENDEVKIFIEGYKNDRK